MWRPFMTASSVQPPTTPPDVLKPTPQLQALPLHLVDQIFDYLNVLDRCCLALSNKQMLRHAQANEHLDYLIEEPPHREQIKDFFERRLGRGWSRPGLRYCSDCGKFVSVDSVYWRHLSERFTREHSGRISDLWRARREDGWLRYWIERWCDNKAWSQDVATLMIRREDRTVLICPRCAITNPDANTWRRQRSQTFYKKM